MNNKLTEEEYKKLVIDIAIKISPEIVKIKANSDLASEAIALYAKDIADAVKSIINDPSGKSL